MCLPAMSFSKFDMFCKFNVRNTRVCGKFESLWTVLRYEIK